MNIESKLIRILVMIGVGAIMSFILILLGCSQHFAAVLTGGVLFFIWPMLGGKW